jgi:hypothetical protein
MLAVRKPGLRAQQPAVFQEKHTPACGRSGPCGGRRRWLDRIPVESVSPPPCERTGFFPEVLDGFVRVLRFGRIDADESHTLTGTQHNACRRL